MSNRQQHFILLSVILSILPVKQVGHGEVRPQTLKSEYQVQGEVLIQEDSQRHG